jgi:adenine phosphoribosyltransferase
MGIHIATAMSLFCRKPFSVIRKRRYGIPGEIEVQYRTGYSESKMYVNGISEGERVVIVDDVVSTGGTLTALSRELSSHGIEVVRAVIVFDKTKDMQEVLDRTGIDIRTMIRVEVRDGRPVVL